jgi:hypothetical protein
MCPSQYIGGTQDLVRILSSHVKRRIRVAYVRCMVVEAEVVVDDGVIGVVRFEQMLQRPGSLFRCCFNIMNVNGCEINGRIFAVERVQKRQLE